MRGVHGFGATGYCIFERFEDQSECNLESPGTLKVSIRSAIMHVSRAICTKVVDPTTIPQLNNDVATNLRCVCKR